MPTGAWQAVTSHRPISNPWSGQEKETSSRSAPAAGGESGAFRERQGRRRRRYRARSPASRERRARAGAAATALIERMGSGSAAERARRPASRERQGQRRRMYLMGSGSAAERARAALCLVSGRELTNRCRYRAPVALGNQSGRCFPNSCYLPLPPRARPKGRSESAGRGPGDAQAVSLLLL